MSSGWIRSLGDEIPVDARLLDQFVVGTLLDDAALVYHQNLIRTPHRLEPVGDHQHGLLPRQGLHSLLELVLILGVHIGRGLIEDDDRRVLQETPGDGDALLLPAGKRGSSLANYRAVSIRQGRDEVVAARLFLRPPPPVHG